MASPDSIRTSLLRTRRRLRASRRGLWITDDPYGDSSPANPLIAFRLAELPSKRRVSGWDVLHLRAPHDVDRNDTPHAHYIREHLIGSVIGVRCTKDRSVDRSAVMRALDGRRYGTILSSGNDPLAFELGRTLSEETGRTGWFADLTERPDMDRYVDLTGARTLSFPPEPLPDGPRDDPRLDIVSEPSDIPITVIVPTYRPDRGIEHALDSILTQRYPAHAIHVVIAVNGPDTAYLADLERRFADDTRVTVSHTPVLGPSAARNHAVRLVRTEWLCFLDDDDTLSPGYLATLAAGVDTRVSVVCARQDDILADGRIAAPSYKTRVLTDAGAGRHETLFGSGLESHFASFSSALFRTSEFQDLYTPLDESIRSGEDSLFWAQNAHRIPRAIHACDPEGREGYRRRFSGESVMFPTADKAYSTWVSDRIHLLKRYFEIVMDPAHELAYRRFVLQRSYSTPGQIDAYARTVEPELRRSIRRDLVAADLPWPVGTRVGSDQGIAFVDTYPPLTSAEAYEVPLTLARISASEPEGIEWRVRFLTPSQQPADRFYRRFLDFHVTRHVRETELADDRASNTGSLLRGSEGGPYTRLVSIGSNPAVHDAAAAIHARHPDVIWSADFGDIPIDERSSAWEAASPIGVRGPGLDARLAEVVGYQPS